MWILLSISWFYSPTQTETAPATWLLLNCWPCPPRYSGPESVAQPHFRIGWRNSSPSGIGRPNCFTSRQDWRAETITGWRIYCLSGLRVLCDLAGEIFHALPVAEIFPIMVVICPKNSFMTVRQKFFPFNLLAKIFSVMIDYRNERLTVSPHWWIVFGQNISIYVWLKSIPFMIMYLMRWFP